MLTDGTVLGRPGVTGWETTSNPDVSGQGMVESREDGTQFVDRLSQPVLTGLESI
jgi:hypothetical protein